MHAVMALTTQWGVRLLAAEPFIFCPKFPDPVVNGMALRVVDARSRTFRNICRHLATVALSTVLLGEFSRRDANDARRMRFALFSRSPRGGHVG